MSTKTGILYSSGLDSWITWLYVSNCIDKDALPVYYNIKHRYAKEEIDHIRKYNKACIIDNPSMDFSDMETDSAYIPNRNLLLAMHMAGKYDCDTIYIGGSLSDRISDNNKNIMDQLSSITTQSLGRIVNITSPFWDLYKEQMIDWYRYQYKGNLEKLVTHTFSCYNPIEYEKEREFICNNEVMTYSNKECMNCSACFRKSAALYHAGIFINFEDKAIINKYYKDFNKAIPTIRATNTLKYIEKLKLNG